MPPKCKVCTHAQRDQIDKALVSGESLRHITEQFGGTTTSVFRHKKNGHVSNAILASKAVEDELAGADLFEKLKSLNRETLAILREARADGDHSIALRAIERAEHQLVLEAKLIEAVQATGQREAVIRVIYDLDDDNSRHSVTRVTDREGGNDMNIGKALQSLVGLPKERAFDSATEYLKQAEDDLEPSLKGSITWVRPPERQVLAKCLMKGGYQNTIHGNNGNAPETIAWKYKEPRMIPERMARELQQQNPKGWAIEELEDD